MAHPSANCNIRSPKLARTPPFRRTLIAAGLLTLPLVPSVPFAQERALDRPQLAPNAVSSSGRYGAVGPDPAGGGAHPARRAGAPGSAASDPINLTIRVDGAWTNKPSHINPTDTPQPRPA